VLVSHFLEKHCRKHGKPPVSLLPSALARLEEHDWPGNVRELENVLARAVISTTEKVLSSDDFTISLRGHARDASGAQAIRGEDEEDILDAVEEQLASEYREALLQAKGNKSHAAKLLGLPESTFRYRLKKYRRFLRNV
jgi:DNA-binding NtrC family response regulator